MADDTSANPLHKLSRSAAKIFADDEPQAATPTAPWVETADDESLEGQLAVDVYQTDNDVVIKAPIAGVKKEDLDIAVTEETVTIKGVRREETTEAGREYFSQECYWGAFSRVFQLPVSVDAEKAAALLKDGILTITLPKVERLRTKIIKVETAQ